MITLEEQGMFEVVAVPTSLLHDEQEPCSYVDVNIAIGEDEIVPLTASVDEDTYIYL